MSVDHDNHSLTSLFLPHRCSFASLLHPCRTPVGSRVLATRSAQTCTDCSGARPVKPKAFRELLLTIHDCARLRQVLSRTYYTRYKLASASPRCIRAQLLGQPNPQASLTHTTWSFTCNCTISHVIQPSSSHYLNQLSFQPLRRTRSLTHSTPLHTHATPRHLTQPSFGCAATRRPTSRKASYGARTLSWSTSSTRRNLSRAPGWCSLESSENRSAPT
jgi:hypothetical protein